MTTPRDVELAIAEYKLAIRATEERAYNHAYNLLLFEEAEDRAEAALHAAIEDYVATELAVQRKALEAKP